MRTLPIFQIDAFAEQVFEGNPAAVIPLETVTGREWLDDQTLQQIAMENNLSETAFLLPLEKTSAEQCDFHLRWFTPAVEVRLCGHATFASAHWFFTEHQPESRVVRFQTLSGVLTVERHSGGMTMSLGAEMPSVVENKPEYLSALGLQPEQVEFVGAGIEYLQVVVANEALVHSLQPDMSALKAVEFGGVIVTARAFNQPYDFVGRFFAPQFGVDEDPVTGSAFAVMAPYWMDRQGAATLTGYQASERGGTVVCEQSGDRILMTGKAITFMRGEIYLP